MSIRNAAQRALLLPLLLTRSVHLLPLVAEAKPFWQEELRANNQQMAIYAAGLLYNAGVPHQDTVRERPVVKVVRQGKTLLALPDAHTVDLCDKQIARYNAHPREPKPPFWAEE